MNSARNIMALIEVLLADGGEIGIRELASRTGIPKSTAQRFLSAMEENGWVKQDLRTQGYRIGYKLLSQSNAWMLRHELINQSRDLLGDLSAGTALGAALSTLDASSGLWIASSVPQELKELAARHPQPFALYASAAGKALLAFAHEPLRKFVVYSDLKGLAQNTITDVDTLMAELESIREKNCAKSCGELVDGASEIAVPLLNPDGTAFAAMSLFGEGGEVNSEENFARLRAVCDELVSRLRNM